MLITSAFAGKIIGSYRYLFLVLYEDYTDFGRAFITEFNNVYLERLARGLKSHGAVIAPFLGDVERTRDEVMSKDWTIEEWRQVSQVIFHFGEEQYGSSAGLAELDKTLKAIAASVGDSDSSHQTLYQIARNITNERPDLGLAFSLQPNIFGFSIDLIKAGSYLRDLIQDRRRPVGRKPGAQGS